MCKPDVRSRLKDENDAKAYIQNFWDHHRGNAKI